MTSEEGDILAYLKLAKAVIGCIVNLAILGWQFSAFKRGSWSKEQPRLKKRLVVTIFKVVVQLVVVVYNIFQVIS